MDAAGVEKQVLSPNHPPYLPDEAEGVKAVQMLNDGYADLAHRYPQRIASYVMLPLPHIDAALKEMERGFDQLGCVGVNMNIICLGRSVAETEFEPIYAEMNRRGAILFVHPAGSGICSPFITGYDIPRVGRHLARGCDVRAAHDRPADPAPLSEHQIHRAASGRADPDAAEPARPAGAEPERPPGPRRAAERHRQEVLVRHGMLWLEGGLHLRARSFWRRPSGDRQRLSGAAGLRGLQGDLRLYQRLGLPQAELDQILHHNAQELFGFAH